MKNFVLSCMLYFVRFLMSFIYFFIKLFPMQKNKITMLSRQSDDVNIDFKMLVEEINQKYKNIKVKILCKKIPSSCVKRIGYCFYIIKCLYHIATSRVCIIDGYVIPISSLKHKKNLIVIQIWHAMGAIKKFGRQVLDKKEGNKRNVADIMKMHKNYTYVMCVSEATKNFFAQGFGIEDKKIVTIGMPRIDYLLGDNIDKKIQELIYEYPVLKEKKNILYVPTFRKGKNTHIYEVINEIDEAKYNLIIKLHPLDKTKIESKYSINEKYKTFELLKIADYVVTDYSAVAFEACVLNKPVLFYLYDMEDYKTDRGLNVDLKQEMPSSTYTNIKNIVEVIENGEYNYEEFKKFKNKYVETIDTYNTERIVKFIINLMGV